MDHIIAYHCIEVDGAVKESLHGSRSVLAVSMRFIFKRALLTSFGISLQKSKMCLTIVSRALVFSRLRSVSGKKGPNLECPPP